MGLSPRQAADVLHSVEKLEHRLRGSLTTVPMTKQVQTLSAPTLVLKVLLRLQQLKMCIDVPF